MTRKIKSLKENECILISTKREARIIKRKKGLLCSAKDMIGKFLYIVNFDFWNLCDEHNGSVILPASDFIKPRLKEQLMQLSDRVGKLEVNGMPVVDEQHVNDYSVSEPYNRAAVAQAKSEEEDAAAVPVKDAEEVKPLVVKTHANSLITGKWYKSNSGILFFFAGQLGERVTFGFNADGYWSNQIGICKPFEYYTEATYEEVSAGLIEEAILRGLISDGHGCVYELWNNELYVNIEGFGKRILFDSGKWADIVEQPKEIDWSVPGQLVVTKEGCLCININDVDETLFYGFFIEEKLSTDILKGKKGEYYKSHFKIYNAKN